MESLYFFFSFATITSCFAFLPSLTVSDLISNHSILPNFTATYLQLLENNGSFLNSINGTFTASTQSASQRSSSFYSSIFIIHQPTHTDIWKANGNKSISNTAKLSLTIHGLSITDGFIWSTPAFSSPVGALRLLETGNLVLVDNMNVSLWESFNYPSDTIVMGQSFPVGKSLFSFAGDTNLSAGDYRLTLAGDDLLLQWMGQTYWKLFMDINAYRNSNKPVSYMVVNNTGLNLYGDDGTVVIQVNLEASSFRMAKLGSEGRFTIMSATADKWVEEFIAPEYSRVPAICGKMGVYDTGKMSCKCPSGFYRGSGENGGCVPKDNTLSLPTACNSDANNGSGMNLMSISYLKLEDGMDYFANNFMAPEELGVNLSTCQDLCSKNCSCLGFFYRNHSGNCYMLRNDLGSIYTGTENRIGYIKTSLSASSTTVSKKEEKFPVAGMVLIPIFGFFMLITIMVLAILWLRKTRYSKVVAATNLGSWNSSSSVPELTVTTLPVALELHKQGMYLKLADPRLEGRVDGEEVEKMVRVALCCVQIVPELRPTMAEVVAMLEDRLSLSEPRIEALNFLQSFGGRLTKHTQN
ncbi:hypothetical protein FEM48_Zijuj06G0180000 [Ziziphus jujuba var. spinosa]|uniref:Apple domain-containing protein n=1 Tax=Ziziphus jujuba var. spinosa TaxID=714518 RepID=A0A978VAS7_ZIZJJ|nr:hypothetical protein FEM48_Zijuj06G0180000 [Ziziphus jujuba var. spinosa]